MACIVAPWGIQPQPGYQVAECFPRSRNAPQASRPLPNCFWGPPTTPPSLYWDAVGCPSPPPPHTGKRDMHCLRHGNAQPHRQVQCSTSPFTLCEPEATLIPFDHGGRRQPMCDPEGCSTVWGAVGGGGGDPHPPPKGGGGPLPPPLVDPNPAPFPAGPVQARKHTKLTRCTVNGHCFAALQHFQSSIECCLEFAQRPFLPLVTNHRHICREAKGATDI